MTDLDTMQTVRPLTDPEMRAWRSFLEAHRRVMDVLEDELREDADLPLAWYDVLVQLSEAEDRSLRMQELADRVLLSKSGLTRLIDRMEDAGLVRREACAEDGRGVLAVLAEQGYARLRDAAPVHRRGVHQHFVDQLTPEEVEVLAAALSRVAKRAAEALR